MTHILRPFSPQAPEACGSLPAPKARRVLLASLFGAVCLFAPISTSYSQTAAPAASAPIATPDQAAPVAAPAAATPALATPAAAPAVASTMPATPPPSPKMLAESKRDAMMREKRIADMHKRLELTPAQENLWSAVASAMNENSAAVDKVTMTIPDKKMSAVENMTIFEAMADAHAASLHRLLPPFSALYATMSDHQKQTADQMFDAHGREHSRRN